MVIDAKAQPQFSLPLSASELRRVWQRRQEATDGKSLRIGLVGSFTIEPLMPYLGAYLLLSGENAPEFQVADYNQLFSVCFNPIEFMGEQPADVLVMLWQMEDLAINPTLESMTTTGQDLLSAFDALRDKFEGTIIIALPPYPVSNESMRTSFAKPSPLASVWHELSLKLIEKAATMAQVYTVDLNQLNTNLGLQRSRDRRKILMYRQPYSEAFFEALGYQVARIIKARDTAAKKCLVLDADNTLWGGVIGEDGIGGIQINQDFPGNAYRTFQQTCKMLKESGIFLAINSKNDMEPVLEVLRTHSGMLLKEEDFSVIKANWQSKSQNLMEIAQELNIGLDSLVFVDDSSFEIAEVQTNCPEVCCLQVPEELADFPYLLHEHHYLFDRLDITEDDSKRVERMKSEAQRRTMQDTMSEESFLATLDLKIFVYTPHNSDLARVTQLVNKTNQFNLMTRRYAQEDVTRLAQDDQWKIWAMSVEDKFGDYGLVGVAMACQREAGVWELNNFLMSCRVLKRGAEAALLSTIATDLAKADAKTLHALYLPTPKNGMCKAFLGSHGFSEIALEDAVEPVSSPDATAWCLDLTASVTPPDYLTLFHQHPSDKKE